MLTNNRYSKSQKLLLINTYGQSFYENTGLWRLRFYFYKKNIRDLMLELFSCCFRLYFGQIWVKFL